MIKNLRIALLLPCLSLIAATQLAAATAKDIQGTWTLDGPATAAKLAQAKRADAADPNWHEAAFELGLAQGTGKMTMILTGDTITMASPDDPAETSHYTIASIAGDTVVLNVRQTDGKDERIELHIDGDRLLWPECGLTLVMKRVAGK